jgi:hypothetical protein
MGLFDPGAIFETVQQDLGIALLETLALTSAYFPQSDAAALSQLEPTAAILSGIGR